ncbi:MAG: hypothetical protein JXB88_14715 [Spirochaetales bacterium]|nr:hypothetical protein [Spirochaetales bacterium]
MFWQTYSINENTLYCLKMGFLTIWIKQVEQDLYIAWKRYDDEQDISKLAICESGPDSQELSWSRWIFHSRSPSLFIKPCLPDRPLIIKPEIPIIIPRGNGGSFFINVPVWIQIGVNEETPLVLNEIPIYILSNSWFGDTISGELCYSKNSLIRKNYLDLEDKSWNAVCAIQMKNNSKSELSFDRFCLHTENLTLYAGEKRLWTSQVKIEFQGEGQLSHVTLSKIRPGFEKSVKTMNKPRKEIDDNIIKKSFQFLKTITGF